MCLQSVFSELFCHSVFAGQFQIFILSLCSSHTSDILFQRPGFLIRAFRQEPSFLPQCVDRIHFCSLSCGIDAGDDTDEDSEEDAVNDV